MPDTRFAERGYTTEVQQTDFGTFVSILHHGRVVAEVAVGIFTGGSTAPVDICIKRFVAGEMPAPQFIDESRDIVTNRTMTDKKIGESMGLSGNLIVSPPAGD